MTLVFPTDIVPIKHGRKYQTNPNQAEINYEHQLCHYIVVGLANPLMLVTWRFVTKDPKTNEDITTYADVVDIRFDERGVDVHLEGGRIFKSHYYGAEAVFLPRITITRIPV